MGAHPAPGTPRDPFNFKITARERERALGYQELKNKHIATKTDDELPGLRIK
jgi:hypothetical protein